MSLASHSVSLSPNANQVREGRKQAAQRRNENAANAAERLQRSQNRAAERAAKRLQRSQRQPYENSSEYIGTILTPDPSARPNNNQVREGLWQSRRHEPFEFQSLPEQVKSLVRSHMNNQTLRSLHAARVGGPFASSYQMRLLNEQLEALRGAHTRPKFVARETIKKTHEAVELIARNKLKNAKIKAEVLSKLPDLPEAIKGAIEVAKEYGTRANAHRLRRQGWSNTGQLVYKAFGNHIQLVKYYYDRVKSPINNQFTHACYMYVDVPGFLSFEITFENMNDRGDVEAKVKIDSRYDDNYRRVIQNLLRDDYGIALTRR